MLRLNEQQLKDFYRRTSGAHGGVVAKKGKVTAPVAPVDRIPIVLTLPWPPSVNHYWLRTADGGMRVSDEGKAFRRSVALACGRVVPFDGDVQMIVYAAPPDKRRRDLDNLLKAIGDSLQHAGVYHDDFQIGKLTIERMPVKVGGEVVVEVRAR